MKEHFDYKLNFTKLGILKYISHLDILRLMQRALRRADLPVLFSKGFHPIPKIKFERALKLGVESGSEKIFFSFTKDISEEAVLSAVNAQLPQGIKITSVLKI